MGQRCMHAHHRSMTASSQAIGSPPSRLRRIWRGIAAGGASLRHRNFRLFFWGQLISLIGTWMQSLAQSWLVYTLTHSAFQLGIVNTFQFLPVLLFSLFAGVIVDRFPRRPMIIGTQISFLLLALVLGVLTVSATVQLWQVYVIAALFGTVNAFDVPARQAFMVEMVGREDLLNGIALNSSIFNASRVFGPAIASLVIQEVGTGVCFLLNAASFIAVIVGLFMMHVERRAATTKTARRPLRQIAEGLSYIRQNERVWLVFAMVSVISVFGIPFYTTLLPIFATNVLNAGVGGLGTLSTCVGAGALVGAVLLAYLPPGPARGRLLLGAALGFGVMLGAFGFSPFLLLSGGLLVLVGFCVVSVNSSGNALIQEVTPDYLRGRVMSVWGFALIGLGPFGSFFAGAIAEQFGAPITVAIGGGVCLAAAIFVNARARRHHTWGAAPAAAPGVVLVVRVTLPESADPRGGIEAAAVAETEADLPHSLESAVMD
jgi:MFS family permease